jgi:hypothetical protein
MKCADRRVGRDEDSRQDMHYAAMQVADGDWTGNNGDGSKK